VKNEKKNIVVFVNDAINDCVWSVSPLVFGGPGFIAIQVVDLFEWGQNKRGKTRLKELSDFRKDVGVVNCLVSLWHRFQIIADFDLPWYSEK